MLLHNKPCLCARMCASALTKVEQGEAQNRAGGNKSDLTTDKLELMMK